MSSERPSSDEHEPSREEELERAAERHREETEGEREHGRPGRLIDRIRSAMRRHDSE